MIKSGDKNAEAPPYMLIAIIIAGAILFLVLFGIFGISEAAEKGLTTFGISLIDQKVSACSLQVSTQFKDSFCGYRKIADNTYMNCEYGKVRARLEEEFSKSELDALGCEKGDEASKKFCQSVKNGEEKDNDQKVIKFSELMTVNGKTCKNIGVTETSTTDSE